MSQTRISQNQPILVFGTVCLDRIRHVPCLPALGAYVEIVSEAVVLGGEAANTAAHLRRWYANCKLLGNAICVNAEGILLAELLNQKDLRYSLHEIPTDSTPTCDIYVTPDGERTMFGLGFSSMKAPPIESFEPESEGWFTTDANLGETAVAYAAKAKANGMNLYLMDLPANPNLLGPGDIWQSSTRWVGERGNTPANLAFVEEITARTGCTAILTDSGNGLSIGGPWNSGQLPNSESIVSQSQSAAKTPRARTFPPFPRTITLDSTGAGDTFRAGMLYGLSQNWPRNKTLVFAAAAASLAAGYIGAAEGPTNDQVEAHIAAHPEIATQYH